jgi:uncharacterized protein
MPAPQRLFNIKKGERMFKILELDGGGIKGIMEAEVCKAIEHGKGRKICEIFDLITGTSTGAILGGCLASGLTDASSLVDFYLNDGPKLFTPRPWWQPWNWLRPKYDRGPFIDKIKSVIGASTTLGSCRCEFMATSFGLSAGRTHFIKSKDASDMDFALVDVIAWSALSAARYFGQIDVPDYKWVNVDPAGNTSQKTGESFQDGGQGTQNCTVGYCLTEILARGITDAGVLSLGTGDQDLYTPFEKTRKTGYIGEIAQYLQGQAACESMPDQVGAGTYVAAKRPGIKFCRLDTTIPKSMDALDNVKDILQFQKMGLDLATNLPAWL